MTLSSNLGQILVWFFEKCIDFAYLCSYTNCYQRVESRARSTIFRILYTPITTCYFSVVMLSLIKRWKTLRYGHITLCPSVHKLCSLTTNRFSEHLWKEITLHAIYAEFCGDDWRLPTGCPILLARSIHKRFNSWSGKDYGTSWPCFDCLSFSLTACSR